MAFAKSVTNTIWIWRGHPDCDAAQTLIRGWLRANVQPYPSVWIPNDPRLQGNLGETIAYCCGLGYWGEEPRCNPANAFAPFSGISRSDIDLLYIFFAEDESQDMVVQQEVKTTTSVNLAYARTVIDDYRKSFGTDPRLLLNTHLQVAKSRLRYFAHRPDLAKRVSALQSDSAAAANRLLIVPTLVHDIASQDPVPRMAGIEAELHNEGWQQVQCWAIGLSDLVDRLKRITEDRV